MQQFHYFVSNGLGWKTGEDLEETIAALWHGRLTDVKAWLLNAQKEGQPGLPFFCCKVPLPADADYRIEFYCPKVEGLTECQNRNLTYYTQKTIAHGPSEGDNTRRETQKLRDVLAAIREHKSYHCPEVRQAIVDTGYGTKEEDAEAELNTAA